MTQVFRFVLIIVFACFISVLLVYAISNGVVDKNSDDSSLVSSSDIVEYNLPELEDYIDQLCFHLSEKQEFYSCIPSFISPGIQKSGTSFLYNSLIRHPLIGRSTRKEVNFYYEERDNPYRLGIETYSSNFNHKMNTILLDFSPKYMMVPGVAELIYQTNKSTKFVVILRDPVTRAYSHYQMQKDFDYQSIEDGLLSFCVERDGYTFKDYITEEFFILQSCSMLPWDPPPPEWEKRFPENCSHWKCFQMENKCSSCFPDGKTHVCADIGVGFLLHSIYFTQISYFLEYFPLENFLFLRYEDILEHGGGNVLNNITKWMGVGELQQEQWGELTSINGNTYPPMEAEVEVFLRKFFREPNAKLEDLLTVSFLW